MIEGVATESLVSLGCIISGENVVIGQHVKIRKAIIDKDVEIPGGIEGITVIPKRAKI